MPQIQFTNLWTQKSESYDPETQGFYAVAFIENANTDLGNGRRLQLGFGSVHSPHWKLSAAIADFVWYRFI